MCSNNLLATTSRGFMGSDEAIYVIFGRKYEFVNAKYAEVFGFTPEELCEPGFDPMELIASESWDFVKDKFREGYQGTVRDQQYGFTGLRKDGSKIECETRILLIPYQWGIAFHGMLRDISACSRIDEDHRKVRDGLLELAGAAEAGDIAKADTVLGEIDTMIGPHFRYEEESLYPAIRG